MHVKIFWSCWRTPQELCTGGLSGTLVLTDAEGAQGVRSQAVRPAAKDGHRGHDRHGRSGDNRLAGTFAPSTDFLLGTFAPSMDFLLGNRLQRVEKKHLQQILLPPT